MERLPVACVEGLYMKPHLNKSPEKSSRKAVLLESSFPGFGAMYAGKVRVGILWLVATWISGAAFVPLLFILALNTDNEISVVAYILVLLLMFAQILWFVVRLALVDSYVRGFNEDVR